MSVHINHRECLMDDSSTRIIAEKLNPDENYKIVVSLKHRTGTHLSYGVFRAGQDGTIDVAKDTPIRGTYDEVNPMGLFASMLPAEECRKGATVWATPPHPYTYIIRLYDCQERLLDEIFHIRHWKHPLVKEIDMEGEPFTGTLYLPPGEGPFPTILDFAGTGGGIRQHRAALLASHGFATVALPFFNYKNLPKDLEDVDLNYFTNTIDWLREQPFCGKLGVQGNSFGGVACQLLANNTTKVSAYCIINSIHFVDPVAAISINGVRAKCAEVPDDVEFPTVNEALVYEGALLSYVVPPETEPPVDRCPKDTKFRIVASLCDLSTPSKFCYKIRDRLRKESLSVELDCAPGGHLMEPPHLPHMPYIFSGFTGTYQAYGGEYYGHGRSQQAVWDRTIDFFTRHLGKPTPLPLFNNSRDQKLAHKL